MNIRPALLALLSITVLISGCASTSISKEAFAKKPKLAVVMLYGSVTQLFTDSKEDVKILSETFPVCLSEISKSRNIQLLPSNAALSTKAYASIKNDPTVFLVSLPGYKQFLVDNEKRNLQALARELNVDGFVLVNLTYRRTESGIGIGPIGLRSVKPVAAVGIGAFKASGEMFWQGEYREEAEDGSFGVSMVGVTAADYQKMIGKLSGLTRTACKGAVKGLAEQVALN